MARIPFAAPAAGSPAAELIARVPHNVLKVAAHSDDGVRALFALLRVIREKSSVDEVLKELAILRIGHLRGAAYEVHHHEKIARQAGMSDRLLTLARDGASPTASEQERVVLAFAEEYEQGGVSEATFVRAQAFFDANQLVDLALACGTYGAVCRFLLTFDVEIEDEGAR